MLTEAREVLVYPFSQIGDTTLEEGQSGRDHATGVSYDPNTLANQVCFGAPAFSCGFSQCVLQLSR